MKGKKVFTKQEVEQLESLIRQKCTVDSSQQKRIRDKMRDIGFYISDFHISNMSIEMFQKLIKTKQIKIEDAKQTTSNFPKNDKVGNIKPDKSLGKNMKQGLVPWVGDAPRVLILGTFPGENSLKSQAYYQNRARNSFYKIMEALFNRSEGVNDRDFLIENHIALWDSMGVAEREGSIDANISDYIPNEIEKFLFLHPSITTIILNGTGDATKVFHKNFNVEELRKHFKIISLPSTANTNSIPFEKKLKEWSCIKDIVNNVHS